MNGSKVRAVRALAEEVVELCDDVLKAESEQGPSAFYGSALTGELRRRSMDLTRALAEMRRP